jgi:cellulose synthase/poly-beta-1,6-N-acetylglucosamine synthase-like glycosyltransferase
VSGALGLLLASIQTALGVRVVWRLWRTGRAVPIRAVAPRAIEPGAVALVVPVLNEAHRLAACLAGLLAQGDEVGEILIVDGGSTDGTRDLVRA